MHSYNARPLVMKPTKMFDVGLPSDVNMTEVRCKYPSKFCGNLRARKSNGQFHRFCDLHRHRANRNQRRWNHTRRTRECTKQCDTPTAWSPESSPVKPCELAPEKPAPVLLAPRIYTPIKPQPESPTGPDFLDELLDLLMPEAEAMEQEEELTPIDWECFEPQATAPASLHEFLGTIDVL